MFSHPLSTPAALRGSRDVINDKMKKKKNNYDVHGWVPICSSLFLTELINEIPFNLLVVSFFLLFLYAINTET